MEKYRGFVFAKLARIGSKMEGPDYFLQQWDDQRKTWDTHIQKQVDAWKVDPKIHEFLAQKVTISGTLKEKSIQYAEIKSDRPKDLPRAEAYRRIDFKKTGIHPGTIPKTFILVVSGTKPYVNMEVNLKPLIYIKRPDYWGIEVVGFLHGVGLPTLTPYTTFIPLDSITGTNGIEVIGATHSEKIDLRLK